MRTRSSSGDSLRGKFVLVHSRGRRAAAELAVAHGAAGVVFLGNPDREPIIGQCYREPRPEPALAIRHADGQKLAARLAAGEVVRLNVQIEADTWDAQPRNVVAEIPGRGPWQHEVVIVSAHLDSWHLAEGAVDNASGSATILEVARALVATGWQPRRTVRFIWFMGEEQGLLGSYAYVDRHADQLDRVVAIVNADMPGSPRNFATSGSGRVRQALRDLAAELRGYAFTAEVPGLGGDWSDHAPTRPATRLTPWTCRPTTNPPRSSPSWHAAWRTFGCRSARAAARRAGRASSLDCAASNGPHLCPASEECVTSFHYSIRVRPLR